MINAKQTNNRLNVMLGLLLSTTMFIAVGCKGYGGIGTPNEDVNQEDPSLAPVDGDAAGDTSDSSGTQ